MADSFVLRPETWQIWIGWAIELAGVTRHIANAVRDLKGDDPAATIAKTREVYNSKLADPTADSTGADSTGRF